MGGGELDCIVLYWIWGLMVGVIPTAFCVEGLCGCHCRLVCCWWVVGCSTRITGPKVGLEHSSAFTEIGVHFCALLAHKFGFIFSLQPLILITPPLVLNVELPQRTHATLLCDSRFSVCMDLCKSKLPITKYQCGRISLSISTLFENESIAPARKSLKIVSWTAPQWFRSSCTQAIQSQLSELESRFEMPPGI